MVAIMRRVLVVNGTANSAVGVGTVGVAVCVSQRASMAGMAVAVTSVVLAGVVVGERTSVAVAVAVITSIAVAGISLAVAKRTSVAAAMSVAAIPSMAVVIAMSTIGRGDSHEGGEQDQLKHIVMLYRFCALLCLN